MSFSAMRNISVLMFICRVGSRRDPLVATATPNEINHETLKTASIDRIKWQRCFAFLQHNQLKGENSLRSGAHEETGRASPFSLSIRMLKQNRVYDSGAVKMQNIAAICCPTLFVCIKSLQVD
jgi:alkyl sulfatase BDS1-like metallo-beta-lactamase superfamily hydrolase